MRLAISLLCALTVAVLAPPAGAAQPGNPLAGAPWFVDPLTQAGRAEAAARATGQTRIAALLDRMASVPQSMWFIAADDPLRSGYVRAFFDRWRAAPGTMAVITLHGLPHQVCAGDNAPGSADAATYRAWIDGWAQRLGDQRAAIVLEPDAIGAARCLPAAARAERLGLMAYAAQRLSALPHVGVYEDAGAGDWLPADVAARMLRQAGVGYTRGFSLNVTHFDWTRSEVAYGLRLSRLLGGKHFVVNTSGNGRGPQVRADGFHIWCNPAGRALGPLPTLRTPDRHVDGLLWIMNPGLSDGGCNGGPTVGDLWLPWALGLARNAARAPDYPALR